MLNPISYIRKVNELCNYGSNNFYNLNNKSVFTTYQTHSNENLEDENSNSLELRINSFEQIVDKWTLISEINKNKQEISEKNLDKIKCFKEYFTKTFSPCFIMKEITLGKSNNKSLILRFILISSKEGLLDEDKYFKSKFNVINSIPTSANEFSLISLIKENPKPINNVEILNTLENFIEISIDNTLVLYLSF